MFEERAVRFKGLGEITLQGRCSETDPQEDTRCETRIFIDPYRFAAQGARRKGPLRDTCSLRGPGARPRHNLENDPFAAKEEGVFASGSPIPPWGAETICLQTLLSQAASPVHFRNLSLAGAEVQASSSFSPSLFRNEEGSSQRWWPPPLAMLLMVKTFVLFFNVSLFITLMAAIIFKSLWPATSNAAQPVHPTAILSHRLANPGAVIRQQSPATERVSVDLLDSSAQMSPPKPQKGPFRPQVIHHRTAIQCPPPAKMTIEQLIDHAIWLDNPPPNRKPDPCAAPATEILRPALSIELFQLGSGLALAD
jgi:hypothetical protein